MEKFRLVGRQVVCGNGSFPIEDIMSMMLLRSGKSVITFSDGKSLTADIDPQDFYAITDSCPWAAYSI